MTMPYIPPNTSVTPGGGNAFTGSATASRAAQTKDMFLKLLVAQMKNQDPTNPASADQLAAQLAQFSSLEQLIGINEKLDGMGLLPLDPLDALPGNLPGYLQNVTSPDSL